jgi:hypothetical protein
LASREIHSAVHFPAAASPGSISSMNDMSLDDQVAAVVKRVGRIVDVPAARLEHEVRSCFADWDDARVRDFVPIFVERTVRQRLGVTSQERAVA